MKTDRQLCWLLRHAAWDEGLDVDSAGWVPVQQVLEYLKITKDMLNESIDRSSNKRIQLRGDMVRATQGHSTDSMPVTTAALEASWDVFYDLGSLWHATDAKSFVMIREGGLHPMGRTHVHLRPERESLVAKENYRPILIEIYSECLRRRGIDIFQTSNGVVMVAEVPTNCFAKVHLVGEKGLKIAAADPELISEGWR